MTKQDNTLYYLLGGAAALYFLTSNSNAGAAVGAAKMHPQWINEMHRVIAKKIEAKNPAADQKLIDRKTINELKLQMAKIRTTDSDYKIYKNYIAEIERQYNKIYNL